MTVPTVSIVCPVLDSHEVLRRQILHLSRLVTPDVELVVVDDGSDPPLSVPDGVTLIATGDFRPWTQPRARNVGAASAKGRYLLFLDIDHIVSARLLRECGQFRGELLNWRRVPACLSECGDIEPCAGEERGPAGGVFLIRADIFRQLGGFDERFCGEYGFDDLDLMRRFEGAGGSTTLAEVPGYYWSGKTPPLHSLDNSPSTRNAMLVSGGIQ